ncbi:hypothetical protein HYW75_00630 [Candidatus Pacearchaeota archaeon]|nr:hypothetical protein [Candidatus Pacearchaeota archaeon]
MARTEKNYETGKNQDRGYGVGSGAPHYGGSWKGPNQQVKNYNLTNRDYNEKRNYEPSSVRERYPISSNNDLQKGYSENNPSRIKPYDDAFSLTFCSRCHNPRPKNGICTKCGGI